MFSSLLYNNPLLLFLVFTVIGIGRGWSIILPYAAATDLLKGHTMDQAVTLVMIAHGLGFLFGTLPPG